ncbi:RanBD1 domain-containing protein [Mycena indigotica]|uniref:RanBD1 domain-containing protein n=1 Tax=Mycena indigotica TaxID=2126181 RepID=A0A8H6WG38_9AGAR|nr:RanBD1 domain-containing protein [Mycena indigotica]KAF7315421.1 RanBD1 domain-containing protein [Mycena indigotica]
MKRGADRQISKEDIEDTDIEEIEPTEGFHKADDAVLATRKIKPMPRRMGGDADKAATTTAPAPKFSGFGTPTNSAFSFTAPSSSPSFPIAKPSTNLFGGATSLPTAFSPAPASTPSLAPTASNAAKTFASFLGEKPSAIPSSAPTSGTTANSSELKYYKSLRGLNVSIIDFLQKALEEDPFADFGSVLSEYSQKRNDIKKEFDGATATPTPSSLGRASTAPSLFGGAPTAAASTFKMPEAPTAFAGFGKPPTSTSTTTVTNGKVDAPPAPPATAFSFGSASASKPSVFTPPASSPFLPLPSSSSSSSTSATSTPFSFATPPTTAFGSTATATTNPFGASASPTPFGSSSKSAPSLFPSSGSTGFSFGTSSTASSNPSGFSFGAPKTGNPIPTDTKSQSTIAGDDETEIASSQETEKVTTDESKSSGFFSPDAPSTMDAEGQGEEDEETIQAARIKSFRMKKKDEPGDSPWIDMGIGFIRLKRHKETAARRLLLRNSHSGKIQINFALFAGFSATLNAKSKSLMFVGHDEASVSQTYNLKFKTEAEAAEFQSTLETEVSKIKSK